MDLKKKKKQQHRKTTFMVWAFNLLVFVTNFRCEKEINREYNLQLLSYINDFRYIKLHIISIILITNSWKVEECLKSNTKKQWWISIKKKRKNKHINTHTPQIILTNKLYCTTIKWKHGNRMCRQVCLA